MRQTYRNKYQDQYRQKRQQQLIAKVSILFVAVFSIAGLILYVLFFANLFDIRSIVVNGPDSISHTEISATADQWLDEKKFYIRKRNNSLALSTSELSSILTSKYPRISALAIKRTSLHQLQISFDERKPEAIWCNNSQECFYFDKEGVAYNTAIPSTGYIFPTIQDQRKRDVTLGSKVIDPVWLKAVLSAKDALEGIDFRVGQFTIPSGSFDEFDAKTPSGLTIMFSTNSDNTSQVKALDNLMHKKLTADVLAVISYIDLRIQDRIYYK